MRASSSFQNSITQSPDADTKKELFGTEYATGPFSTDSIALLNVYWYLFTIIFRRRQLKWTQMAWYSTKFYDDQFRHLNDIRVIIAIISEIVMLVLLINWIYEFRHRDCFMWHTVPPPFSFTVFSFDKVDLAFMWLAASFERTSHYTSYITFLLNFENFRR
jgi:hypothetical protein